ncbi:MAG: carbohydrate binding family 9 domain-containing protein, partial [Vicinamibacterales bacterium]
ALAQAPVIDGPPAPVAPTVVNRDAQGRATVRAIKLTAPLDVDGRLDDEVYASTSSISDFIQQVPREGAKATERTEAWVMFDQDMLYVAARCWDTASPDKWVANELRRDTNQLRQNDTFGVILDTFYDRRNGYLFYTNPLGARADQAVTDEGNLNPDWNPVWDVRTGRFDGGWTVEMANPL